MHIFTSIQTGAFVHVSASNENWNHKKKLKQISQHIMEIPILTKIKRKNTKTNTQLDVNKLTMIVMFKSIEAKRFIN